MSIPAPLWAYSNIPAELQALPQWVCWRYEQRDNGRHAKVPINAATGSLASVTNQATWNSFDGAVAAVDKLGCNGIGMVFSDADPYTGIDIDDANGNQALKAKHDRVEAAFHSYSETSPSGKGLHIIVKGRVQGGRREGVEVYSRERFFTFTGHVKLNAAIHDGQHMLDALQAELGASMQVMGFLSECPQVDSDDAIIARMMGAANAEKVRRLVDGDGTGMGDGSGSGIDLAIVNTLQFYTKNIEQIERIWLSTPHAKNPHRLKKLARRDYRLRTIRLAFDREPPQVDLTALQARWAAEAAASAQAGAAAPMGTMGGAGIAASPATGATTPGQPGGALGGFGSAGQVSSAGTAGEPPVEPPVCLPSPSPSGKSAAKAVDPYTVPPGLLGDVAKFIFDAAPRQVEEIALAGAIGLMGGICGRAYNIHGDGLNVYIALLASSGSGKEAVSNGYSALQTALLPSVPCIGEFIGPANFASVQGLLRFINKQASAVSVVGEFGGWLHDMIGDRANPVRVSLKMALLEVYGKSGKKGVYRATEYSAKDNNIAAVASPALSIVGETTPSTFYRAITQATIEDGFLPRFILIEYEGKNAYHNEAAEHVTVPPQLVADLAQLAGHALTLNAPARDGGPKPGPITVGMTHEASVQLKAFSRYCTDRSNDTDNEGIKNVWARVYMNAAKLAALVAVGCNAVEPKITLEHADWAINLVAHSCGKLTGKVASGDVAGDAESKQYNDLLRCLREVPRYTQERSKAYRLTYAMVRAGIINTGWLGDRLCKLASYTNDRLGPTKAKDRVLARALDEKLLTQIEVAGKHKTGGTCYMISTDFLNGTD